MKTRTPLTEAEKEKAKVLHAGGATGNAIANNLGRNRRTVQKFLDRPATQEQVAVQREAIAGMLDSVVVRTIDGVTDEDIRKASLQNKMVSVGIAIDKAAMLRGETPTGINIAVLLDVIEAIKAKRDAASTPRIIEGQVTS